MRKNDVSMSGTAALALLMLTAGCGALGLVTERGIAAASPEGLLSLYPEAAARRLEA